jgi:hypothetical protein
MTSEGLRLLQDLRCSLPDPPRWLRLRIAIAITSGDCRQQRNVSATA